jgi:tetratricopeptide (TPR) repeat protein
VENEPEVFWLIKMHTTLDFHIQSSMASSYSLEVFERGSSQPLAQSTFQYDISFLNDFFINQLDFDLRDPYGRMERLTAFGTKLYSIVFSPVIRQLWHDYKQKTTFLELCLRIAPEARRLEAMPWETLHDGEEYLAAGVKTSLSRLPLDIKILDWVDPVPAPCKMLAFLSCPLDLKDHERMDLEGEQEILLRAVNAPAGQGKIELVCEEEAKLPILENSLEDGYHIFHYLGHGIAPEGGGGLLLEDADGKRRPTGTTEILAALRKGEKDLRLVVISGCQTARALHVPGFRDLARELLQCRFPSVIAMQFSITDTGSLLFAENLYPRLLKEQALPIVVGACRRALLYSDNPYVQADAFSIVLFLSHPQPLQLSEPSVSAPPVIDFSFHLPLPQLSFGFYGRRKEYRDLRDGLIYQSQRAIIIHGIGGIGKTALVTRSAWRLGKYFKGVYGFDCSSGTMTPETMILELHRYFERQNIPTLTPLIYQSLPPAQLAAYVSQVLIKWPLMLIFDNFEAHLTKKVGQELHEITDAHMREFLTSLIQTTATGSRFLFTSRYLFELDAKRVGRIHEIPLHDLTRPEAIGVMQKLSNLSKTSYFDKVRALETFGGNPYALVILDRHCGIKPLVQIFSDAAQVKAELREFLALELSYAGLSAEARHLLHRLAAFRQPFPYDAAEYMIREPLELTKDELEKLRQKEMPIELYEMTDAELKSFFQERQPLQHREENLDRPLRELICSGLLTPLEKEEQKQKFAVHCLVRDFCREKELKETWRGHLREAALCSFFVTDSLSRDEKIAVILEAFELLMEAESFTAAAELLINNGVLLDKRGLGRLWETLCLRVFPFASHKQKGILKQELARIYLVRGEDNLAIESYGECFKINKDMGNIIGMAESLLEIGNIYFLNGQYEAAQAIYEESCNLSESIDNRSGIAKAFYKIGITQHDRGNYQRALDNFEKSLKISEEINDPLAKAKCLRQIGFIHHQLGECDAAKENYKKCITIQEEKGDHHGLSHSFHKIGLMYFIKEDYEEAIYNFEKSLKMDEEHGDRKGMASSLHQIGLAQYQLGDYKAALDFYKKSLKIVEDIGDQHGVALCLNQVALIQHKHGNYEAELDNYKKSLTIFLELDDHSGIIIVEANIGRLFLELHRYPEAFEHLLTALVVLHDPRFPITKTIIGNLKDLRAKWGGDSFDRAWKEKMGTEVPDFLK